MKIFDFNDGVRVELDASNQAELETHLQHGTDDPQLRYIAIESPDSRSSLRCSHAMFTYLSSFHQISPSFIPAICSFGRVLEPKDVCLAFLDADESRLISSPDRVPMYPRGRSGSEIQLSYLLRVVEKSTSRKPWNFIVRPLAVYHSYDVQTGRALWVTVKGNRSTREQICEVLEDQLRSGLNAPENTFAATLDMHLSIMETVEENWQSYINEIDQAIRETVSKASNARIDIGPHFEQMQQNIMQHIARPASNAISNGARVGSLLQSIKSGFQKTSSKQSLENQKPKPTESKENEFWKRFFNGSKHTSSLQQNNEIQDIVDKYLKLDNYSFEDNQDLHRYGEAIQEAILTIKLDADVIHGLGEFYQCEPLQESVAKDKAHPDFYRLKAFAARLKSLENSLCVKQQQLEGLEKFIREAKVLYDGVSQYRSVQISKIYAQSAQASAQRMEKIAGITEKETASMHIITLVTLVFLPGTFIASFLQSGVFQWKDEDAIEHAWLFRGPVFEMFMEICLVMMFVTFVVWFVVFRCLRGRSQGQNEAVVEKDASQMV